MNGCPDLFTSAVNAIEKIGLSMKKLLLTPVLLCLAGCSANSLSSSGQNVIILQSLPSQYHCVYKGEVAGSQGNWMTGGFTTNKNLALGARNDLRNEASKLGANVVVISESISGTNESNELKSVTHVGRAYRCSR